MQDFEIDKLLDFRTSKGDLFAELSSESDMENVEESKNIDDGLSDGSEYDIDVNDYVDLDHLFIEDRMTLLWIIRLLHQLLLLVMMMTIGLASKVTEKHYHLIFQR